MKMKCSKSFLVSLRYHVLSMNTSFRQHNKNLRRYMPMHLSISAVLLSSGRKWGYASVPQKCSD